MPAASPAAPGPARVRGGLILAACSAALWLAGLDATALAAALPSIGRDLHAGMAGLAWVTTAYTLTLASLLILAGSLADRFGRRRVFACGLTLFTLGTVACSLAPGLAWLAGFRAAQAAGAAACNPVSMAIIRDVFRDPVSRARATGVWTAAFGGGLVTGPSAGGFLVTALGWRSVFWVTVPVALAALVLTLAFVPESRAPARRPDIGGQVLVTVLMAALVYAVISGPSAGWHSPRVLAALGACAVSAALLARTEPRRTEPLISSRLLAGSFAGPALAAAGAFGAVSACLFEGALDLQDGRGYSAAWVAVLIAPLAVLTLCLAPLAGRLTPRWGPVPLMAAGGVLVTAGGAALARLGPGAPLAYLAACFAVVGAGYGIVNAPATFSALGALPPDRAGMAAGVMSASRYAAGALAVAAAGTATTLALHGARPGPALASAARPGFAVAAACGLGIIAGAAVAWRRRAQAPGARHARRNPKSLVPGPAAEAP